MLVICATANLSASCGSSELILGGLPERMTRSAGRPRSSLRTTPASGSPSLKPNGDQVWINARRPSV